MSDSFTLTPDERRRIIASDSTALKRDKDPGDIEGQVVPVLRQRAHRRPVYDVPKFSGQRVDIVGTQDLPEHLRLWIVIGKVTHVLKSGKSRWTITFTIHDERQTERVLRAGVPIGPKKEPGLKTRQRTSPEKPRKKGEGVGSFTPETERGYGGSGPGALDHGGVDDEELHRQKVKSDERFAKFREEEAAAEQAAKQQRAVRQMIRESVDELGPEDGQAFLARIERAAEAAREEIKRAA